MNRSGRVKFQGQNPPHTLTDLDLICLFVNNAFCVMCRHVHFHRCNIHIKACKYIENMWVLLEFPTFLQPTVPAADKAGCAG